MTKKLTILHTNDMHGDFFEDETRKTGGLPRLSGYVNKVRDEEENVIYAIAGDMFQGSVIDTEFHGLSTIDLVNMLSPDVATIGNHEVDYGIAHLLFLEKCAKFPIINANLFITMNNARLFTPYLNIEVGGMNILFIGILTDEVLATTKNEKIIGSFINIDEAAKMVSIMCDNYRTTNTDMVVLLTHIGIENDRKLAEKLDKELGVNLIIGGHTHTFMDEPEEINGIKIVQAGYGSDQIGRFDIELEGKEIVKCDWKCVPINDETSPIDPDLHQALATYQNETDKKYKRIVTRLRRKLTHPERNMETEIGNLYADAMADGASFDIMVLGSGSLRKKEIGPVIDYQTFIENTPFDSDVTMLEVTGKQFRHMCRFMLRDEAWQGHTEFYQFSKGIKMTYNKEARELVSLTFKGKEVLDEDRLTIGLQNYHYKNFEEFFDVPLQEVKKNMKPRVVATSINNIFEEYFTTHHNLDAKIEGRINII